MYKLSQLDKIPIVGLLMNGNLNVSYLLVSYQAVCYTTLIHSQEKTGLNINDVNKLIIMLH